LLLVPEVIALMLLNLIFLVFGFIAFITSLKIVFKWDINQTTQTQYNLEKQSYLASVIIKYIFILKLPLILFFIFTLDKLSVVIPGAMCAAGVVNATVYGNYLIVLKIINIYIFGFWLKLHSLDISFPSLPYTKLKFSIYSVAFFLLIGEIVLEFIMFKSIDPTLLVDCCGTLYSSGASSYISYLFLLSPSTVAGIFYISYLAILVVYFLKQKELFAIVNFIYLIVSIISLILVFGTYIYELPTHHCPFCFLQKDYYYVGYLIYTLLFVGTFNGIVSGFIKDKSLYKTSLIFNTLYLILVSLYPIVYYYTNRVWL